MIHDCMTKYGNQYSMFRMDNDPDIVAICMEVGAAFVIDTESKVPLCYALNPFDIDMRLLNPVDSIDVEETYLEALVNAEELLIEEQPFHTA